MVFAARNRCFKMCTFQDLQTKSPDSTGNFVKSLRLLTKPSPFFFPFRINRFCCLGKPSRRDSGQFTCSVLAEIAGALGSLQDSGVSAKRGASGSNCAVTWVADWRMGMDGPTSTLIWEGFVDWRVPWNYGNSWGPEPPPPMPLKHWKLDWPLMRPMEWGGDFDGWSENWTYSEKNHPPPFRMFLPYFLSLWVSQNQSWLCGGWSQ